MAAANNPTVITALFNDAAAKDAVDVAFSQLMPQVSLQGQMFQQNNAGARSTAANGYQAVAQLSGADLPGWRGVFRGPPGAAGAAADQQAGGRRPPHRGAERGAGVGDAGRREGRGGQHPGAIRANEIALEGVEREAIVGSRTTLDVLNAQQALLNSRITLVQNLAQVVTASYQVAVGARAADRAGSAPAGAAVRRDRVLQRGEGQVGWPRRLRDKTSLAAEHARLRQGEAKRSIVPSRETLTRITCRFDPGAGSAAVPPNDPSMEDILASIRRILSEDEVTASAAPAPRPQAMPSEERAAEDGVLVLDTRDDGLEAAGNRRTRTGTGFDPPASGPADTARDGGDRSAGPDCAGSRRRRRPPRSTVWSARSRRSGRCRCIAAVRPSKTWSARNCGPC